MNYYQSPSGERLTANQARARIMLLGISLETQARKLKGAERSKALDAARFCAHDRWQSTASRPKQWKQLQDYLVSLRGY